MDRSHLAALGCGLGQRARAGSESPDAVVVLDFGMPMHHKGRFGASLFDGVFRNTLFIASAVESYAAGFVRCSRGSNAHLELAAGTSNYGPDVSYKHGRLWGAMVNRANAWLRERWLAKRVHVAGANDIEPGWDGPGITREWIHSYASIANSPYYYYGGAAGCPPYAQCIGGWTMEDVWYAAWGSGVAVPLPEIYANSGANAAQWYTLSLYSYQHHGKRMDIAGAMTQIQSCRDSHDNCRGMSNHPAAGWSQLWLALNKDSRTAQPLRFLTDIAWRN
ncbi:MAG: hypothetical protein M3Q23_06750 [Actinomycetota bacterium]|nr:hypothetical protein [Actinomycetota bacterium]